MKNDLTTFEKNLLRGINFANDKNYTHKNFMEWSNSKTHIEKGLLEGEKMYEVSGYFVAIKEAVN